MTQLMAKEYLRRETCLKTLYYQGKEIDGFVFYNEDGVVHDVNRGYLDNVLKMPSKQAMDDIPLTQVRRARVVKFENKDNFFMKGIMYIYCGKGGDFELIKREERQQSFDTTIHTYERLTFLLNGEEVAFEKCIKVEDTPKGKAIKDARDKLKELGVDLSTYDIQILLENNLLNI